MYLSAIKISGVFKRLFILISVTSLVAIPTSYVESAAATNYTWTGQSGGITGSSIVGVAVSEEDSDVVYALTASSGVYRSVDGGSNWSEANTGLPTSKVTSSGLFGGLLTMDPNDSATLYAVFNGKIHKTTASASSWAEANTGITQCVGNDSIVGVVVDPNDSNHLLAGQIATGCSAGDAVHESIDGGTNWSQLSATGLGNDSWMIALDHNDANNIYIATTYQGFMRSTNGGATFTRNIPSGGDDHAQFVGVSPSDSETILYGDNQGFYVSEDSGQNWTLVSGVGKVWDVAYASSSLNTAYAASNNGVFKSTDGGINWSEIGDHSAKAPRTLAVDPADADIVYMGTTGGGMYKSTNGGTGFSTINTGLPTTATVNSVAIDPNNSSSYYATVTGQGFFKSTDRGYNWTLQSTANSAVNTSFFIEVDPSDSNIIYSGGRSGSIYKSTDNGVTWPNAILDNVTLAFPFRLDPVNSSTILVYDHFSSGGGITSRSADGGDTWTTISFLPSTSSNFTNVNDFEFDPNDNDIVYAATIDSVYKSEDNGVTWARKTDGITTGGVNDDFFAIEIDPNDSSIVYAAVGGTSASPLSTTALYKSTDYGETWENTGVSITRYLTGMSMDSNSNLYIFTQSNFSTTGATVYKSTDGGDTLDVLLDFGSELPFTRFAQAVDPIGNDRFIGGTSFAFDTSFWGFNILEDYIPIFSTSTISISDDNGGSIEFGDTLSYTVTVNNSGPAQGTDTDVTVDLPANFSVKSGTVTIGGASVSDPSNVFTPTFSASDISRSGSLVITFDVAVSETEAATQFATITSDEDTDGTNTNSISISAVSIPISSGSGTSPSGFSGIVPFNISQFGLIEGDVIGAREYNDPDVYIVNDYGYKRLFLNPVIFFFYGHLGGFDGVKLVTTEARDGFPTSGLFRNCETNDEEVYGVEITAEDEGMLHWIDISSEEALREDSDFFKKVFCINNNEFEWYEKGDEYNSLSEVPIYVR